MNPIDMAQNFYETVLEELLFPLRSNPALPRVVPVADGTLRIAGDGKVSGTYESDYGDGTSESAAVTGSVAPQADGSFLVTLTMKGMAYDREYPGSPLIELPIDISATGRVMANGSYTLAMTASGQSANITGMVDWDDGPGGVPQGLSELLHFYEPMLAQLVQVAGDGDALPQTIDLEIGSLTFHPDGRLAGSYREDWPDGSYEEAQITGRVTETPNGGYWLDIAISGVEGYMVYDTPVSPPRLVEEPISGALAGVINAWGDFDFTVTADGQSGTISGSYGWDGTGLQLTAPPNMPEAWLSGDPHLLTLDGVAYDFHAAGEFVLLRATDGTDFELQIRTVPVTANATATAALSARLGGVNVELNGAGDTPLLVDGLPADIANGGFLSVGADRIHRAGDTYTLVFAGQNGRLNDGDSQVAVVLRDGRIDIDVRMNNELRGKLEGLLGDGDGNPANDIALADGTVLDRPLSYDSLYGQYRDDWRVSEAEDSLFTYRPGEGPDSFWLPQYPYTMASVDDFSADAQAAARAAVAEAGIAEGTVNFDNAVLDYLLTGGDSSYLASAAQSGSADAGAAAPVDTSGGLAGVVVLSGRVADRGGEGVEARLGFNPEGSAVHLPASSDADGQFSLRLPGGSSGVLEVLSFSTGAAPELSANDALAILRMVVGLDSGASWQDQIAADMNGNGSVEASDALEVLRHVVQLDTDHAPRWVFVDGAQSEAPAAGGITIEAAAATEGLSLTAIYVGHVAEYIAA